MSELQKRLMKKMPPKCPRSTGPKLAPLGPGRRRDYAPVSWRRYFSQAADVESPSGTFRLYLTPEPPPPQRLRVVTLHGGGYSGLSWALFTEELLSAVQCQVVSIDLRGHGETRTGDDDDLNGDTLANDVSEVLVKLFGEQLPPTILVGHSMGGAVAVRVASLPALASCIEGVAVIDVVEGTAMESLASMQSFLRSRPTHFRSIEHAIEWCVRSGQVRNVESAKVSMPSQIINCASGLLATRELDDYKPPESPDEEPHAMPTARVDSIAEEAEDEQGSEETAGCAEEETVFKPPGDLSIGGYRWRIDLSRSERHWPGWFRGLSAAFLAVPAPRLLLLASIDGLDRELTVGQMQGKFQMQVLPRCGHAVHEDRPHDVARAVAAFALRYRLTELAPGSDLQLTLPEC